jgi:hypothetical protein
MKRERFRRIEQVFDAVADAAPQERDAVLARLCGDDAALRAEVESLLAAQVDANERIRGAIRREANLTVGDEPRAAAPNVAALCAPSDLRGRIRRRASRRTHR